MELLTVGIEEELHVVDLATGDLVPRGDELLAAVRPSLGDAVTRELNLCQIETSSPICRSLDEVTEHLRASRGAILAAGAPLGLGVVAVGTHPTGRWEDQQVDRSQPRYRALTEQYQALALEHIICGCHIHVGFRDPDERYGTMTRLRRWLPMLLALSANSPFWQGEDTGYASFRHEVWRRWPTSGIPPEVHSAAEHEAVVEELIAAEVVQDATNLYWDIRPSARYPTVEIRAFDTLLRIEDAATLTGLVRALVWTELSAHRAGRPMEGVRSEVLEAGMWRSARDGVADGLLSVSTGEVVPAEEAVAELLAHCAAGLDAHGDLDAVTAGVAAICERGNGAVHQRALAEVRGTDRAGLVGDLIAWTGGGGPELTTAA